MVTLTSTLTLLAVSQIVSGVAPDYCTKNGQGPVICQVLSDVYYDNETLENIAAEIDESENVVIYIKVSHLHLNKNISFKGLTSLAIQGDPTVINCTSSDGDTGMLFIEIMNITLNNLKLISCGSRLIIRKKTYSSALTLQSCGEAHFTNLNIIKSQGIGLTILNHEKGRVSISQSSFRDNTIKSDAVDIYGGGGVYVGEFQQNSMSSVTFAFEHCSFERNNATTRYYHDFYTDEYGESRTGYGQGGGIFLALENSVSHRCVIISVSNCKFSENQGFFGGGLSVRIGSGGHQRMITEVTITLKNSIFEKNGCNSTTNKEGTTTRIGGGAYLSFYMINSSRAEYNLQNVSFIENCAEFGGGVHFFSYWHKQNDYFLHFDNCTFEKNRAHTGSAVDITPSDFVKLTTGQLPVPKFTNCTFFGNIVSYNSDTLNTQKATGIGTLHSSLYDIRFEGENSFENNIGTAVYVVNAVANFANSKATFSNNRGIRGGAVALLGSSSIIFGPDREYTFFNNTAYFQGGAIFVDMINTHDFTLSRTCFLQYFDGNNFRVTKHWNTNITFTENKAQVGRAIFATSLHPCIAINNGNESNPFYITVKAADVFTIRGINIDESEVATAGAQLQYKGNMLRTIPGEQINHSVTVMDDTGNLVEEPLRTKLFRNKTEHNIMKVSLDSAYSFYVGQKIQLNGNPGDQADLMLQTVSSRLSYALFKVVLKKCPPGFAIDNNVCICNSKKYYGLRECNIDKFFTYLMPGLWTGLISDTGKNITELVTYVCPLHFCEYNLTDTRGVVLPQSIDDLDTSVCGTKRKGVLCGRCGEGYTVHFHSPDFQCKSTSKTLCKVGWLFYLLSELVPITIVFITVTVLNINFTSGAVNGFILFSQVLLSLNIDASGIIAFPNKEAVIEGYQFLYGFLNLDFFTIDTLSFCLWPNATALDMLAFKFISIVYALSLVILVIWFMNKCGGRFLGKWCRITKVKSSIIHGISAFFIICYSQSILVSYSLINGGELWLREDSNMSPTTRVWLNGDIVYFSTEHLPYALPALFCLLTIGTIPPALLIAYPLFNRILAFLGIEESKPIRYISQKLPINGIKPLLDSFQGCFKDHLRFFAGLYFLYRWIAPVVYSTSSGLGTAYIVSEIFLILMLVIHSLFQPYQQRVHNVVDTLLFMNLLLINSITIIHYAQFQGQDYRNQVNESVAKTAIIQIILIYLPLSIMLLYLLKVGSKQVYLLWNRNKGNQGKSYEQIDLPAIHKLRDAVQTIGLVGRDTTCNDNDLPHRLITGEVSYECFEDVDHARETYAESKSKVNDDTRTY